MTYEREPPIEPKFDIKNFFNTKNLIPTFNKDDDWNKDENFDEKLRLIIYTKIIEHTEFGHYQTEFADYWAGLWDEKSPYGESSPEVRQKIKEYLQQKLHGQILIDLGCGERVLQDSDFSMGKVVKEFGASQYIGIDSKDAKTEHTLPPATPKFTRIPNLNNGHYLNGDILLTLATAPSESANLVINGMDNTIIRPEKGTPPDSDYNCALMEEMVRVCRPSGVIFGQNSTVLGILSKLIRDGRLQNLREIMLIPNPKQSNVRFFEKISE